MLAKTKLMRLWLFSLFVLLGLTAASRSVMAAPIIASAPTFVTYGDATTTLTITGSGFGLPFSGTTSATLNGLALAPVSNTPNTVTVSLTHAQIVSLGAGPFPLIVTNGVETASVPFAINKAVPLTAVVSSSPGNASTFGASVTFTATVSSGAGTPSGSVQFKDGAGNLGAAQPLVTGQAMLTTSTLTVGSHSITAVYSGNANFSASPSAALTQIIMPGPPATVTISAGPTPSPLTADNTFTLSAIVKDAGGNNVADTTPVMAALVTPGGATLTGSSAMTMSGVATFSVLNINKVGAYTLTVSSGTAPVVTSAPSSQVTVTVGAPASLTFVPAKEPTDTVAGQIINGGSGGVQALLTDAEGNPVSGKSVLIQSNGPTLLGNPIQPTDAMGVATFGDLQINSAANGVKLTASVTGVTPVVSNAFNITAGAAKNITIGTEPPASVSADNSFGFSVTVTDIANNNVPNGTPVSLTLLQADGVTAAAAGTTLNTTSGMTVNGGVNFSNLKINKAGTYTLKVTSGSATAAVTSVVTITPGIPASVTIDPNNPPATSKAAGQPFTLAATVTDAQGNPVVDNTGVTLQLFSVQGGVLTPVPGSTLLSGASASTMSGVANFLALSINKVGTYQIKASSGSSPTVTSAPSNTITITPGALSSLTITAGPTPSSLPSNGTFSLTVSGKDANGNNVADNVPVTLTLLKPDGTAVTNGGVLADTSTNPATVPPSGVTSGGTGSVTFTLLNINTVGTYTVQAGSGTGSGTVTSALSNSITVTVGTGITVTLSAPTPASVTADHTFSITATVKDTSNNPVPNGTPVALALLQADGMTAVPAGTTLTGATGVTTTGGVATFTALNINKVGSYTLKATSDSITSAASSAVAVTLGVPSASITTQPTPSTVPATGTFSLTVTVKDSEGNPVPDNTPITLSLTNADGTAVASGVLLTGATGVTSTSGVATFSTLNINKVGTYILTATATAVAPATFGTVTSLPSNSVTVVTGTGITVTVGAPSPASVTADNIFSITATVKDSSGNTINNSPVTLSLFQADGMTGVTGGVALTGGSTATNNMGVATFNAVNINTVGTYTLKATSNGVTSAASSVETVTIGAISTTITSQPSPSTRAADQTFSLKVSVQDAEGNTVPDGTVVTLAPVANPAKATLTGGSATTVNGVATFSAVNISKVGTYNLTASIGTAPNVITSAPSNTVAIVPGAPHTVTLSAPLYSPATATSVTADNAFSITAAVTDSGGNPVIDGTPVSLTLLQADGKTAVLAGTTFTGATGVTTSGGVATFSALKINKVGSYTLKATSGSVTSAVSSVTVTLGALGVFITSQPSPSNVLATGTFSLGVTVKDNEGNPAPDSAPITLSLVNANNATLTDTSTTPMTVPPSSVTSGGTGSVTFTALNIDKVGSYTITASIAASSTVPNAATSAPSSTVVVGTGTAFFPTIASGPTPATVTADQQFALTATVVDANSNNAPDGTPVTLTLLQADGKTAAVAGTTLTGGSTTTAGGTATFSALKINKVGSYTLIANSTGNPSKPSGIVTITLGALGITITGQPSPSTVLSTGTFSLSVTVQDKEGNPVPDGTPVTLSLVSANNATLTGAAGVTTTGGAATFSALNINKDGSYTITASIAASSTVPNAATSAPSSTVVVGTGTAFFPTIASGPTPATVTADQQFALTATVVDANSNNAPDGTPVTLTLLQADGKTAAVAGTTLTGGSTTTAGGTATFSNLQINLTGSYTLIATVTGNPSKPSGIVTITPGITHSVAFTAQPTSGQAGVPLGSVVVTLKDAYGNLVGSNHTVTMQLSSTVAVLTGTLTAQTDSNGNATFSNLSVDRAGVYSLTATGDGIVANSASISFTSPGITLTKVITADLGQPFIPVGSPDFSLTIMGSGFVAPPIQGDGTGAVATTVQFGANAVPVASVTVNSTTQITALIHGGISKATSQDNLAGPVTVTVTNTDPLQTGQTIATTHSASSTFTILPLGPSNPLGAASGQFFGGGLQMLSVPFDYSSADFSGAMTDDLLQALDPVKFTVAANDITLAVWDPTANGSAGDYALTSLGTSGNLADTLVPGQGYWGRFPDPAVKIAGVGLVQRGADAAVDVNRRFTIHLQPGWNMIGDPFTGNVTVIDIQVQQGGAAMTLANANDSGLISQTFYQYGSTSGYTTANTLTPYVGYWVHAYQPCDLLVPHP